MDVKISLIGLILAGLLLTPSDSLAQLGADDEEEKENKEEKVENVDKKSPVVAFGLSLIFTGGGQYYNGQHVKGAVLTGLAITGGILIGTADKGRYGGYTNEGETMVQTGASLIVGSALYSIIDAPIVASNINDRARQQSRYGHFMEFQGKRYTVGLDPVHYRERGGIKIAVHF